MVGEEVMSSAKREILQRVRQAIGEAQAPVPHRRTYRQTATVDLDGFVEKLRDYNAGVYRCAAADVRATVAQAMSARGKSTLLIPPGLAADAQLVRDEGLSYEELDRAEGVLTACTVAISMTGTIMLCHTPTEGRRALTLIPDYHLCLVRAEQVVETVPEGIRRLRDFRTRPITTISGPSATADIDMIRVKGVHGPRVLDVILIA